MWGMIIRFIERVLDRVIEFERRRRGGYYRTIKKNQMCPACGSKNGEIFYNPEIQRIVHTCGQCNAAWPEKPRVPASAWDFLGRDLKANADQADTVREIFRRANTPILAKPQDEKQAEVS